MILQSTREKNTGSLSNKKSAKDPSGRVSMVNFPLQRGPFSGMSGMAGMAFGFEAGFLTVGFELGLLVSGLKIDETIISEPRQSYSDSIVKHKENNVKLAQIIII